MAGMERVVTAAAGGLAGVESALLLIGMNLPQASTWSTPGNLLLASSDVILGGLLMYLAVSGSPPSWGWLYYAACSILLVTHLYREAEYIEGWRVPFTRGVPLFVLNNVRLALLGTSLGLRLLL